MLLGNFLRSSGNAFDVHANKIRTMDNTEQEKETLIRNDRITTTRKIIRLQRHDRAFSNWPGIPSTNKYSERRNNSILYGRESGRSKMTGKGTSEEEYLKVARKTVEMTFRRFDVFRQGKVRSLLAKRRENLIKCDFPRGKNCF